MCALLRIGIFVKRQNCLTFKDFSSPHHHDHRYFLLKASATCFKVLRDRVFRLQAAGTPWGNTSWDRVVSPRAAGIPRLDATSSWKRPRCSLKSSWNPRLLITCCWNTHPRLASLEYRSPDTNLSKAPTGGQTPAPDLAFYCHPVFIF